MKGIILAGGSGTRLYPITRGVSKQLLPVYNKPMIYYPLSVLMLAGMHDILIITTPHDSAAFQALLGDGSQWGISLQYAVQPSPDGLAQAFIIGRDFIGGDDSCLILGDNLFFGHDLESLEKDAVSLIEGRAQSGDKAGAVVFGYHVSDPERYGVVEFDAGGRAVSIEEKPENPRSNYAVTGLYFYDKDVCDIAASLKPSPRGELEITDVNRLYLQRGDLHVKIMKRGFAWLDTGTFDSLIDAGRFVQTIETRQGQQIACIEEIAYRRGLINDAQLEKLAQPLIKNAYGQYLMGILDDPEIPNG